MTDAEPAPDCFYRRSLGRTLCGKPRPRGAHLSVSDKPFAVEDVAGIPAFAGKVFCPECVRAMKEESTP